MITIAIAAGALVLSAVSLAISTREARRGNSLGATVDLFREYRTDQMRADRRCLREALRGVETPQGGVTDLPEPAAQAALRLCHYLDHMGVLVAPGLFPLKLTTGFMGVTAVQIWEELHPYIEYERGRRFKKLYLEYFEDLAVQIREMDVAKVRSPLRSWGSEPG